MITLNTKKIKENLIPFIDEKNESYLRRFIKDFHFEVSKEVILNKINNNPDTLTILEVECLYFWLCDLHDKLYSSYQKEIKKIRKTGSVRADVLKMDESKFLKYYGVDLILYVGTKTKMRAFLEVFYDYFYESEIEIGFFIEPGYQDEIYECIIKDLHHFSNYFLVYCGQMCVSFSNDDDIKKEAEGVLNDIELIDSNTYSLAMKDSNHLMDNEREKFIIELMDLFYYAQRFEKKIVNSPINTKVWNFHT